MPPVYTACSMVDACGAVAVVTDSAIGHAPLRLDRPLGERLWQAVSPTVSFAFVKDTHSG